jgi:chemotaxis protein MotB
MARKKKHEEHQNHEAWAIPYGDLVTLLFALFTVMYAMSSVNEGKYRVLSDSLVAAFRGTPKSTTPITLEKSSSGKGGDRQLSGMRPTALMKLRDPKAMVDKPDKPALALGTSGALTESIDGKLAGSHGQQAETGNSLYQMADEVRKALQDLIDKNLVHVRQTAFALEVEINTDILFPSGVARVEPSAIPVLGKVAQILKPFPNAIRVEGHTDNRPIATAAFPSNWELSAARAANVVQLFAKAGVDPLRMQVLGLGEFRPSAPNTTAAGRNANRRVVVVITEQPPVEGKPDPVSAALAVAGTRGEPVPGTVLVQKAEPKPDAKADPKPDLKTDEKTNKGKPTT